MSVPQRTELTKIKSLRAQVPPVPFRRGNHTPKLPKSLFPEYQLHQPPARQPIHTFMPGGSAGGRQKRDFGNWVTRLPAVPALSLAPAAPSSAASRHLGAMGGAESPPGQGAGTYCGGQVRRVPLAGLSARTALCTVCRSLRR